MQRDDRLLQSLNHIVQGLSTGKKESHAEILDALRELFQDYFAGDLTSIPRPSPDRSPRLHWALGLDACSNLVASVLDYYVKPRVTQLRRGKQSARAEGMRKAHFWLRFVVESLHRGVAFDDVCAPLSWTRSRIVPYVFEYLLDHMRDSEGWSATCVEDAALMHKLLSCRVYVAALSPRSVDTIISAFSAKIGLSESDYLVKWEEVPSSSVVALCGCLRVLVEYRVFPQSVTSKLFEGFLQPSRDIQRKGQFSHAILPILVEFVDVLEALLRVTVTESWLCDNFHEFLEDMVRVWEEITKDTWRMSVMRLYRRVFINLRTLWSVEKEGSYGKSAKNVPERFAKTIGDFIGHRCRQPENILHTVSWREVQHHQFTELNDLTTLIVDALHFTTSNGSVCSELFHDDLRSFLLPGATHSAFAVCVVMRWLRDYPTDFYRTSSVDASVLWLIVQEWESGQSQAVECFAVIETLMGVPPEFSAQFEERKYMLASTALMPTLKKLAENMPNSGFWDLFSLLVLDYMQGAVRMKQAEKDEMGHENLLLRDYQQLFSKFEVSAIKECMHDDSIRSSTKGSLAQTILPFALLRGIDMSDEISVEIPDLIKLNSDHAFLRGIGFLAFHCCWKNGMSDRSEFARYTQNLSMMIFSCEREAREETDSASLSFLRFFFEWCSLLSRSTTVLIAEDFSCMERLLEMFIFCAEVEESPFKRLDGLQAIFRDHQGIFKEMLRVLGTESRDTSRGLQSWVCTARECLSNLTQVALRELSVNLGSGLPHNTGATSPEVLLDLVHNILDIEKTLSTPDGYAEGASLFSARADFLCAIKRMSLSTAVPDHRYVHLAERIFKLLFRLSQNEIEFTRAVRSELFNIFEAQTTSFLSVTLRVIQSTSDSFLPEQDPLIQAIAIVMQGVIGSEDRLLTPDRSHLIELINFSVVVLVKGSPSAPIIPKIQDFAEWAVWHEDDDLRAFTRSHLHRLTHHEGFIKRIVERSLRSIPTFSRKRKGLEDWVQSSVSDGTDAAEILCALFDGENLNVRLDCFHEMLQLLEVLPDICEASKKISETLKGRKIFLEDFFELIFLREWSEDKKILRELENLLTNSGVSAQKVVGKIIFTQMITSQNPIDPYSNRKKEWPFHTFCTDLIDESALMARFGEILSLLIFYSGSSSADLHIVVTEALSRVRKAFGEKKFVDIIKTNAIVTCERLVDVSLLHVKRAKSGDRYIESFKVLKDLCGESFPGEIVAIHILAYTSSLCAKPISGVATRDATFSLVHCVLRHTSKTPGLSGEASKLLFNGYINVISFSTEPLYAEKISSELLEWIKSVQAANPGLADELISIAKKHFEKIQLSILPDEIVWHSFRLESVSQRQENHVSLQKSIILSVLRNISGNLASKNNESLEGPQHLMKAIHDFLKNDVTADLCDSLEKIISGEHWHENFSELDVAESARLLWIIASKRWTTLILKYLCLQTISRLWGNFPALIMDSVENVQQDVLASEPYLLLLPAKRRDDGMKDDESMSVESTILNCVIYRILNESLHRTSCPDVTLESCRFLTAAMQIDATLMKSSLSDDLLNKVTQFFSPNTIVNEIDNTDFHGEYKVTFDSWICAFTPEMLERVISPNNVFHLLGKLCRMQADIAKLVFLYIIVTCVHSTSAVHDWIRSVFSELVESTRIERDITRFLIQTVVYVHFRITIQYFVAKSRAQRLPRPIQGKDAFKCPLLFGIPVETLRRSAIRVNMPYEALLFTEMGHNETCFPSLSDTNTASRKAELSGIFAGIELHGKAYLESLSLGATPAGRLAVLRNRGDYLRHSIILDAETQYAENRQSHWAKLSESLHRMNLRQVLLHESFSNLSSHNTSSGAHQKEQLALRELQSHAAWSQAQWSVDVNEIPKRQLSETGGGGCFHACVFGSLQALAQKNANAFSFSTKSAKEIILKELKTQNRHAETLSRVFMLDMLGKAWEVRFSGVESTFHVQNLIPSTCTSRYPIREVLDDLSISLLQVFDDPQCANHIAHSALHAARHNQPSIALSRTQRAENQKTTEGDTSYICTLAKTFWQIDERDFAFDILSERANNVECAFLLAKWTCQAKRESVSTVLDERLLPLASKIDTAAAHFACAVYQDEIYSVIRGTTQSIEHQEVLEGIDASTRLRDERHADFQQKKCAMSDRKKMHVRRHLYQQDRELKRSLMEIDQTAKSADRFCIQTIVSYAKVLRIGGLNASKMLTATYRFVSIWLENASSPEIAEAIALTLPKIPTKHFIGLFPQICSRLAMPTDHKAQKHVSPRLDSFQRTLWDFLKRIITNHPNATLHTLFALANGARFPKGEDELHAIDKQKVTASVTLLRELLREAEKTDQKLAQTISGTNKLIEAYIELAFVAFDGRSKAITPKLAALREIPHVEIFTSPDDSERMYRFDEGITLPGGINVPKVIRCISHTGRVHKQLVKSKDDLRQDALVQQVFRLCNTIFTRNDTTLGAMIRTYRVVPLTPTSGIVEWVEHTLSIGDYLTGPAGKEHQGVHYRYHPDDMTHAKVRTRMHGIAKETLPRKLSVYREVCDAFTPCFRQFFLEHSSNPAEAYKRRVDYTLSVAASSIVGYIVGLGDRHNSNVLIDRHSGELIQIDIGLAFEEGMLLPEPELVPFRLTRDIVDAMGITGTEGLFRKVCEGALHSLRGARKMVNTVIETLLHDPLAKWSVDYHRIFEKVGDRTVDSAKHSVDAERASAKVNEKLLGIVGGENLSVEAHVQVLVQQAKSEVLLCQMFHGWSAWV